MVCHKITIPFQKARTLKKSLDCLEEENNGKCIAYVATTSRTEKISKSQPDANFHTGCSFDLIAESAKILFCSTNALRVSISPFQPPLPTTPVTLDWIFSSELLFKPVIEEVLRNCCSLPINTHLHNNQLKESFEVLEQSVEIVLFLKEGIGLPLHYQPRGRVTLSSSQPASSGRFYHKDPFPRVYLPTFCLLLSPAPPALSVSQDSSQIPLGLLRVQLSRWYSSWVL